MSTVTPIAYSRRELLLIGKEAIGRKHVLPVPPAAYRVLQNYNICTAKSTVRGKRGEKRLCKYPP